MSTIAEDLIKIAHNTPEVVDKVKNARKTVSGQHQMVIADAIPLKQNITVALEDSEAEVIKINGNIFDIGQWLDFCASVNPNGKGRAISTTYLNEEVFSFNPWRDSGDKVWTTFNYEFKENTQYTISFEYSYAYNNTASYSMAVFYVYYTDGTGEYVNGPAIPSTSFTKYTYTTKANKTVLGFTCPRFGNSATVYLKKDIQLVEGTSIVEPQIYTEPNVNAINSNYERFSLTSVSPMTCTYYPIESQNIYTKYQELVAKENELLQTF